MTQYVNKCFKKEDRIKKNLTFKCQKCGKFYNINRSNAIKRNLYCNQKCEN